jgi:hypothetical protein
MWDITLQGTRSLKKPPDHGSVCAAVKVVNCNDLSGFHRFLLVYTLCIPFDVVYLTTGITGARQRVRVHAMVGCL